MSKTQIENCFECGKPATENHHVIPKVLGGTKTVPLCTLCHMKVHGLDKTKRADNHCENVKRGLDKSRAWELFAVYQSLNLHDSENIYGVREILKNEFDYEISINRVKTLLNRVLEMDETYLQILFDREIDTDLSFIWNPEDFSYQFKLYYDSINSYLNEKKINISENEKENMIKVKEISKIVNEKFLLYKMNKTIASS